MSGRLSGLSVLVAGGCSGIGRAAVEAYLAEGATVTVLDLSRDADPVFSGAAPGQVTTVVGDATVADDVDAAVAAAVQRGGRLDHVTCCVGVFDQYVSVRDLAPDRLASAADEVWRANVLSVLLMANRAYPALRAARGSITVTLSASAFYPDGGGVLYGSSKWALRGVVAHLAHDLAPEVRVNGVAPAGTVATRLRGLSSLGQRPTPPDAPDRAERIRAGNALRVVPAPSDHAGAYLYLADPHAARIVSGAVLNTDGGR